MLLICGRGNIFVYKITLGKQINARKKAAAKTANGQQFSVQKKQRSDSAFLLLLLDEQKRKANFIQEKFLAVKRA